MYQNGGFMNVKSCVVLVLFLGLVTHETEAQSLKGSSNSIGYQFIYAHSVSLTFLPNVEAIRFFVEGGVIVKLEESENYRLFEVSHPYVLPTTRFFVKWFASEYRLACGEELVVTSATRPINQQPSNASPYSVHPTGMSVDFRVPMNSVCRRWLERTLLALEYDGRLDVTLEENPWHYHVAVYLTQNKENVLGAY